VGSGPQQPRVLDAGCGRQIKHRLWPDAYVVGIDVDEDALALNHEVDEKIVGDVQTYLLPPASYDAITCFDVLEHLPHPEQALANLARALRPGGTLHIGIPNLDSPKAIATKVTPHWFHVWFYRRIVGDRLAGMPGHGPYKTYLRRSLRPAKLGKAARSVGLELESVELLEAPFFTAFWRRRRRTWAVIRAVWHVLGLGDPALSECVAVMRKPC
jgi:2-polyprenyl-3-methyl-5-hydroxy-6-metoxy-1,4-benzoquinol methylase